MPLGCDSARAAIEASPWLLDILAAFGAEAEDREPCLEDEPSDDREAAYT